MVAVRSLVESASVGQWGTERNGDGRREKIERQRELAGMTGVSTKR